MPNLTTQTHILLGLLCCLCITVTHAQTQTPTPSPIVVQSANTGRTQPFTPAQVAQRTNIAAWQQAGFDGSGRRVGVLDRGFAGLQAFADATNATIITPPNTDIADYSADGERHGTRVLEVIHALAPNAMFHVCAYDDLDGFVRCIDQMLLANVHIINHSAGVPALPLDGSGRWATEVNRAADQGVLWINAAGNFARGYIQDVFEDDDNDLLHEFRGIAGDDEALGVEAAAAGTVGVAMLSWGDLPDVSATEIDLALEIIDAEFASVIATSDDLQDGGPGQQSLEYVAFPMDRPFAVRIRDRNMMFSAAGTPLSLFVSFADLPGGERLSSVIAPADARGSLTVGAQQGINIAPYSSCGPLDNGAVKPDLITFGEIALESGPFIGTSAAAPVIAAAAALVWQSDPTQTAQDVRQRLSGQGGFERNCLGEGRLLLQSPFTETQIIGPTPRPQPTNTPPPAVASYPCDGRIPGVGSSLNVVRILPRDNSGNRPPVQRGSTVMVLDRVSDFGQVWYQISYNSGTNQGWIPEDFVNLGANCGVCQEL